MGSQRSDVVVGRVLETGVLHVHFVAARATRHTSSSTVLGSVLRGTVRQIVFDFCRATVTASRWTRWQPCRSVLSMLSVLVVVDRWWRTCVDGVWQYVRAVCSVRVYLSQLSYFTPYSPQSRSRTPTLEDNNMTHSSQLA